MTPLRPGDFIQLALWPADTYAEVLRVEGDPLAKPRHGWTVQYCVYARGGHTRHAQWACSFSRLRSVIHAEGSFPHLQRATVHAATFYATGGTSTPWPTPLQWDSGFRHNHRERLRPSEPAGPPLSP